MKLNNFLKPKNMFGIVFILQLVIYLLFYMGMLKSYKVHEISINYRGYIFFITIYIMLIVITGITTVKTKYKIKVKKQGKIYLIIYLTTVISVLGLFGITEKMRSMLSWNAIKGILFTNATKEHLQYGGGYIPLITLALVSVILLMLIWRKNKKNVILLLINIFVLTISGILLNSRIMILQPFLYIGIILLRLKLYNKKISVFKSILGVIIVTIVFVLTSGIRDYNEDGKYYTNSKIDWGITRVIDYPLTTTNYSLEILSLDIGESNYSDVFEILRRFEKDDIYYSSIRTDYNHKLRYIRSKYGALEYTNLGGIGQVYYNTGLYSIAIFIIYAIVIKIIYISYNSGKLFGIMLYPIFFYSIIEFWRLFFIGTEQISIVVLILIVVYMIIKDCFIYEKINDNEEDI